MNGKERICVFGGCKRQKNPDETDPEPSLEVYYPEDQMWKVADSMLSQPRKEFTITTIKAEEIEGPIMSFLLIYSFFIKNQPAFSCCSLLKSSPGCQKS